MSDDLRERIARALKESFYPDRKSRAPESEWLRRADAVLAVLRDTPPVMTNLSEPVEAANKYVISVCPTCGSDDPKVCAKWNREGTSTVPHQHGGKGLADCCPDPFHSQGEPCEDCGDTGVIVHEGTPWPIRRALGYTDTDSTYEPCPRGCTPEGKQRPTEGEKK